MKGSYNKVNLSDFSDDSDDAEYGGGLGATGRGRNDDDWARSSRSRQQQLFQEQDHGLEMLAQSAERLGQMSMGIHEELGHQNKMLDDMDQDLEQANQQLDFVTRKTKDFIQQSGGQKNFCIILALIAVVIVLILLILYT